MAQNIAFKIYIWFVTAAGFFILLLSFVFFPISDYIATAFFMALAFVAETQTIFLGNEKSVSVGSAVVTASMLTCGTTAAICVAIISLLGSISKENGKKKHIFNTKPSQTLFNMSNYAISSAALCYVYFGFNGKIITYDSISGINSTLMQFNNCAVQLVAAVVSSVIINLILVGIGISIKEKVNIFRVLVPNLLWPIANVIIIGILGVFLTLLYVAYGWFLVVLFFLPFMLARYAFTTYKDLQESYLQTVESLAFAIEAKDEYTSGHSRRVGQYCSMLAHEMKLSEKRCETLKYAALLHDIGKIGIPEDILNKPGKLNEEEMEQIFSHPEKGAHIIEDIRFLADTVDIVLSHHERYSGGGYPTGRPAKDMSEEIMIICAADAYDAMTSDRPYRPRMTVEEAIKELERNSGTQFSPRVVEAFKKVLAKTEGVAKPVGAIRTEVTKAG